MKTFVALSVFAMLFAVALGSRARREGYDTEKYHIDLEGILSNDDTFQKYFKCLMTTGECSPEGEALKKILPEALATGCAKCNEKQRDGARKVLVFLIEKKNAEWKQLEAKYDPAGVFQKKYDEKLKGQ